MALLIDHALTAGNSGVTWTSNHTYAEYRMAREDLLAERAKHGALCTRALGEQAAGHSSGGDRTATSHTRAAWPSDAYAFNDC